MASELVGTILRDRRESLGLSIEHMARITNIRPRLLETFESSDYDKYPPKGYASGMLSSYARALGLDPRPILSGFELELMHYHQQLEIEAGAHNVREGRDRFGFKRGSNPSARRPSSSKDAKSSTGSMESVPGATDTAGDIARATSAIKVVGKTARTSGGHRIPRASDTGRLSSTPVEGESRLDAYKRSMSSRHASSHESPSASASFARTDPASTGRLTALAESTGAMPPVKPETSDEAELMEDDYELRRGGRRRPTSRGASSRSKRYSSHAEEDPSLVNRLLGMAKAAVSDKRTRMIVIAVALILVLLILVASLLMSTAGNEDAGILDVTGGNSGATTTETGTDKSTGAAVATVTTANGNPVVVSVDVEKGKTSLVTVTYDDDKAFDGTAVGPWHRDFQVTKSFSATIGTPSAVTVKENGTPIEIPTTEDGSGKLEINVQASGLATSKE